MRSILLFSLSFLLFCGNTFAILNQKSNTQSFSEISVRKFKTGDIDIEFPTIIICDVEVTIDLKLLNQKQITGLESKEIRILVNGNPVKVFVKNGLASFKHTFKSKQEISIQIGEYDYSRTVNPIPLWLSILPPLIAILIALLFKEVFTALLIGLFVGTSIIFGYQEQSVFIGMFRGLLAIVDTYIYESLINRDHVPIIVFSMLIGAMVNLISRNGGMRGVVNILSRYAKSPRSGQFVTWLLGIVIFFDDYANTLVVGNTMRPVTDKLRISREKLSYIVDSTAAPIAAIAFVTTWIGAELSYIQNGITTIGIDESAYNIFINSLQYSYYPILTLLFVVLLIIRKRDFGPMYTAEINARKNENFLDAHKDAGFSNQLNEMEISEDIKPKWFNAGIPVLVVIFGTIIGLISTGLQEVSWDNNLGISTNLSNIIGNANSFKALMWSSFLGVIVAILLTLSQRILSLKESIDSLINGFRTMLTAILILILAWSLALITDHLHTAQFISQLLISVNISPFLIPALTFVMAAAVAFSTGSSWGTMAILYPLILPASWLIATENGLDYDGSLSIFYNVVSAVLAGSVFGDHCSPISDTTILSSLASNCNHIEHVRTQLPYAITVGLVSIFIGIIPAAYGVSSFILFPVSIVVLYLIITFLGKST